MARAFVTAGHEVRVAAPISFATTVTAAGFVHVPFADAPPHLIGPVMARLPLLSFADADTTVIREVFARIDAQASLPALVAAIDDWRPDLLLREPAEFGSLAAAERAGVAHLQVAAGMVEMSRLLAELTVEPLAELAGMAGLPDGAVSEAAASELVLSSVPELLDRAGDDAFDPAGIALRYCDPPPTPQAAEFPTWGDPTHPMVYVTFGSVAGSLPPFAAVFRNALEALAEQPLRVFMTVGRRFDRATLDPLPANAQVAAWWPQADLLARASAVWGHGGFGTTMGALTAGLPQLVTPLFSSDQRINARHVAAVGAGRVLAPDAAELAGAELSALLTEPTYAARARAVAAEIRELPPAEAAVSAALHRSSDLT